MDMHSREQYLETLREEYRRAGKQEKSQLLNEARWRTRLNRKVLFRKLAHPRPDATITTLHQLAVLSVSRVVLLIPPGSATRDDPRGKAGRTVERAKGRPHGVFPQNRHHRHHHHIGINN